MRVRTTGAAALLVVMAGGMTASCDRDNVDAGSREVAVLVLAIRDVVSGQRVGDSDDALPVVYVVGNGEHTVAATVQSDVAAELHDEIDVRFADDRDEAIEIYRSERDESTVVFTFTEGMSNWAVTATSLVSPDA